jgi:hypothetical protein
MYVISYEVHRSIRRHSVGIYTTLYNQFTVQNSNIDNRSVLAAGIDARAFKTLNQVLYICRISPTLISTGNCRVADICFVIAYAPLLRDMKSLSIFDYTPLKTF